MGLYYYGARWYDPSVGRFISTDPRPGRLSDPQSLNLYIYVINSPLNLVDPWGEEWWNPFTWTEQQKAQAFTIAVIVVSVVAVVATAGLATPIAAAVVGAAIGASVFTSAYTFTAGADATLAGAAGAAVTGAVAGAIGGGAGAAFGLVGGAIASGAGSALGNVVGGITENLIIGKGFQLNLNPSELALDFGLGALTFGYSKGMGKHLKTFVAEEISSSVGRPTSRVSLLVKSLWDQKAHPRATYQEIGGLLTAAHSAGWVWNGMIVKGIIHQHFPLPES
jgi:hypothetical protein